MAKQSRLVFRTDFVLHYEIKLLKYIKSLFICKITAAEKHAGGSDKSHTVKHSTGDSWLNKWVKTVKLGYLRTERNRHVKQ